MVMKPGYQDLRALCPDVSESTLRNHIRLFPSRYFECWDLKQVAEHARCLDKLSEDQPIHILVSSKNDQQLITIICADSPSLLSLLAGVLSACGFHILDGDIFTSASPRPSEPRKRPRVTAGPKPMVGIKDHRKVIDCFVGKITRSVSLDQWIETLEGHLGVVAQMLRAGKLEHARQYVNELVVEGLHEEGLSSQGVMPPIEMTIKPNGDGLFRMKIIADDTPFFLYSISMALALRGVLIERVSIRTSDTRIIDTIYFRGPTGRGMPVDDKLLNEIKLSVLFAKHFTYSLPAAPDPYQAICRFEQFVEDILSLPDKDHWLARLASSGNLDDLARILGASDFMWEDFIRNQYEILLPILDREDKSDSYFDADGLHQRLAEALKHAKDYAEQKIALNQFKDRELFLIDLNNILHGGQFAARLMAENINLLAEAVISTASDYVLKHLKSLYGTPRTVGRARAQHAIMGLGKCGGVALGYASDIELLFVYSDSGKTDGPKVITNAQFYDYFVREFTSFISSKREGIFDIDLRLRPYGNDGPLASSLLAFSEYFGPGGEALPYHRLSLVRMRYLAGDKKFGRMIERLRDEYIYYSQSIDFDSIRDIRRRQHKEKAAGNRVNAKYSRGALVDLEYDVQILQVMYAHQYKELKTPRIHLALERLAHAGILDSDLSERLNAAYYFFRDLTNGLRMLRGSARDLYLPPPDSVEFGHLARRMGYKQLGRLSPRRQLYLDFESHTAAVRSFVETQFGKGVLPGRPGGNIADLLLGQPSDEQVESILGAKGFDRPATAFKNFQALYSRATHKQTFLRMAILACDFLQLKPDPDMALNNWERFAGALIRVDQHFEILQTQPKRLEMLLAIFSASQFLADLLINNPEFFDWVSEDAQINKPLDLGDWSDQLRALSRRCPLRETWLDELRRLRRRDLLRIATRDTCLGRSIVSVVAELSDLAQGVLTVALERIWDEMEEDAEDRTPILELRVCFSILAYGKLGGRELNYSSDIDIVGIHTGRYHPVYSLVMKRLCMDLTTHTAEGHAYRVDLRLRPYGHQGSVVSGVPQFLDYYRDKAQLWELQALLKARPVAGNLDIGQSALDELKKLFLVPRESSVVAESIHTLRSQMVELTGTTMHGTLDVKNGEGGIRDIEFLAQGLQLIHANRHPSLLTGNTIEALRRLHAEGLISTDDAALLGQRYIYFRRVEHFLQLLHDIQVHHLPSDEAALKALARRVQGPGSDAGRFVNELSEFMRGVRARYLSLLALG